MALTQRLDLRQAQSLVMTPQLQQAIKMLQLSSFELAAYVDEVLETNPLLEREEASGDAEPIITASCDDDFSIETVAPIGEAPPDWAENAAEQAGAKREDGTDLGHIEAPLMWSTGGALSGEFGEAFSDDFIDRLGEPCKTLRCHLTEQLGNEPLSPVERFIAAHLIDLVDDAGYLSPDYTLLASQFGCDINLIEAVLAKLQGFEPTGVAARNLEECLALQLRERDRLDPAMAALLRNLPLIASQQFDALKEICGVDAEDLADMLAEIRSLNPKPGLAFDPPNAAPLIPELLMRSDGEAGWILELNPDALPRVLVNNHYYTKLTRTTLNRGARDFISECYQNANWLVKSLHQRANTILKVGSEIVRQQDAFFAHGITHLRPLALRHIAAAVEMHESTISRVTANKYIASPRGLFELRYFFTASIASFNGAAAHSAEAVRYKIKNLIEHEPANEILSDDRIVELLVTGGIDIARRTVAKYREALHIPSSVQRRREKSLRVTS